MNILIIRILKVPLFQIFLFNLSEAISCYLVWLPKKPPLELGLIPDVGKRILNEIHSEIFFYTYNFSHSSRKSRSSTLPEFRACQAWVQSQTRPKNFSLGFWLLELTNEAEPENFGFTLVFWSPLSLSLPWPKLLYTVHTS